MHVVDPVYICVIALLKGLEEANHRGTVVVVVVVASGRIVVVGVSSVQPQYVGGEDGLGPEALGSEYCWVCRAVEEV